MTRGRKTSVELKAEIVRQRLMGRNIEEIEASTGVPNQTVSDITNKEIGKLREYTPIIAKIIEDDMETLSLGAELNRRFANQVKAKSEVERNDIETVTNITKEAFKRSQIYQGRATDKIEHELSEEQMRIIAGRYLK